jgi:hypothetical protein
MHENREGSCTSWLPQQDRSAKAINRTVDVNVQEQSDCVVVPMNQPKGYSGLLERVSSQEAACCTFRGSVTALRAKDGTQIWKTCTISEKPKEMGKRQGTVGTWGPSGVGAWASPKLDAKRGLLYVATGDNF